MTYKFLNTIIDDLVGAGRGWGWGGVGWGAVCYKMDAAEMVLPGPSTGGHAACSLRPRGAHTLLLHPPPP